MLQIRGLKKFTNMFAILYLKELLLKINFYIKTNYLFLKLIFLFLNIFQLKNFKYCYPANASKHHYCVGIFSRSYSFIHNHGLDLIPSMVVNRLEKFRVVIYLIHLKKHQVKALAWLENATDKSDHLNALTVSNAVIYPSQDP